MEADQPTSRLYLGICQVEVVMFCLQHVVGRLYYPAKPRSLISRVVSPPLTWIRDWHYAKGEAACSCSLLHVQHPFFLYTQCCHLQTAHAGTPTAWQCK